MKNNENSDSINIDKVAEHKIQQCQRHLKEIIDSKPVMDWAKELDVSKSLISSRWKKDHFPNIPNIIKLLVLSGFSANWLLLGIGPKYIGDAYDPDQSAADELRRREITADLFEMEHQLTEMTDKVNELKRYIEVHQNSAGWMKTALTDDIFSQSSQQIKSATGKSAFKQHFLPLLTLMQLMNHICFKFFEAAGSTDDGQKIVENVIKFINQNIEKNQYSLQSALADLEPLFNASGINKLFSGLTSD